MNSQPPPKNTGDFFSNLPKTIQYFLILISLLGAGLGGRFLDEIYPSSSNSPENAPPVEEVELPEDTQTTSVKTVEFSIRDSETKQPLEGVTVLISPEIGPPVEGETDNNGYLSLQVEPQKEARIFLFKDEYNDENNAINLRLGERKKFTFVLEKTKVEQENNTDSGDESDASPVETQDDTTSSNTSGSSSSENLSTPKLNPGNTPLETDIITAARNLKNLEFRVVQNAFYLPFLYGCSLEIIPDPKIHFLGESNHTIIGTNILASFVGTKSKSIHLYASDEENCVPKGSLRLSLDPEGTPQKSGMSTDGVFASLSHQEIYNAVIEGLSDQN